EAQPKEIVAQESTSPSRYVANVLISLRDSKPDQAVLSKLTDACQSFMEALNYNLDTFDDPVHDPFFQKLVFVNKTSKTEKDIHDNLMRAKELLETAFMRKNENHDDKLSKAAAEIVNILKEMNDYVMLLGNVMIVQYSDESVQSL